jgi:hypothetical protein
VISCYWILPTDRVIPKNEEISPVIFSLLPLLRRNRPPVIFFRGISPETLMESAFVDDIIVIFDPFLRFSPVFCPVVLGKPRVWPAKATGKFFQDPASAQFA